MANEPRLRCNNGYYVIYQYVTDIKTGKKKQQTLKKLQKITRKQAEKELAIFSRQTSGVSITFQEALEVYDQWYMSKVGQEVSQNTFKIYRNKIAVFHEHFWNMEVEEIKYRHVEKIKDHLVARGLSNRSINIYLSELSKFMKYCLKMEWIKSLPAIQRMLENSHKIVRFLNVEEVKKLSEKATEKERLYLKLMLNVGLRRFEAINLKWDSIFYYDKEERKKRNHLGYIEINAKTKNKKKIARIIPITESIDQVLREHPRIDDYVCVYKTESAIDSAIKRLVKRSGVKLHSRLLRSTYGTLMSSKVELIDLMKLLGHKKPQTTANFYVGIELDKIGAYSVDVDV